MKPEIILLEDVQGVADGATFPVAAGTVVSSLAAEEAQKRGIRFIQAVDGLIGLAADHGGFQMKEEVKSFLEGLGYPYHDFGTFSEDPVDYPDLALLAARAVAGGRCRLAIIVDGAGIGSCMTANKVKGVRAALCYDEATARNSREHNFANVLTLGGRMISVEQMKNIVRTWLQTPFGGERHRRRVEKIMQAEGIS